MPRDPAIDSTLSLLREGYTFISERCERFGSDVFTARLLGERTICIRGREAAAVHALAVVSCCAVCASAATAKPSA